MKKVLNRSLLTWFLALAFFVGLGYFTVRLVANASEWAQLPMNAHLSSTGLGRAGTIYDRNGIVLAQSVDGERFYNDDGDVRAALLHTVGDNGTSIATAVQSVYRNELVGYNFLLGLGLPESFRSTSDITLTVDANACAAAYNAMAEYGYKGAAVVYNYRTGEIICKVSAPTYDPINPPEIQDGDEAYEGAYIDKVISASFPPGSTFKLITAAAAIEEIDNSPNGILQCDGGTIIGGEYVTCVQPHGSIDMNQALAESCNIYFAELAVQLGNDKMTQYAENFGFNKAFTLGHNDICKSSYNVKEADTAALAWSGVGQYTDLANPMHMAMICSAIANGGTPTYPYLIKDVSSFFHIGNIKAGLTSDNGGKMMKSTTANKLADMMRYTVSNHYGDSLFGGDLHVAAKTGTAEVGDGTEDGWIVGFVTDDDCPLAFAVVIENGGFGIESAAPVARAALEASAYAVRGY
ncbi:MAG: penicillin-binding protein [Clostridia bacterium]|nr:penicillin-binding protein [Clostridia bacterium]